jgi:hydroxymethylbilane synthase
MNKIIIGSRGSDLALWQANHVKKQLENLNCEVEIKIIITQGDAVQNLSFDKLEGKGFFTKEIENELLDGKIDLAVHSHKDLETNPPDGLKIAAVSDREDPRELLLINKNAVDDSQKWNLANKKVIGTSSARRKSLINKFRNDLIINELRGNVPTRIDKLRKGDYDAILLAKAGVERLKIDLSEFYVEILDPTEFVPAPAQGVLGLQIRSNDVELEKLLKNINNSKVEKIIEIERKVLNLMEGGCQLPLGVFCPNENEVFVSYSQNVNLPAQLFYFEIKNRATICDEIVRKLSELII